MQINQIDNYGKCTKPSRKFGNFMGSNDKQTSQERVRYKHFEQMDDDVLAVRSIIKAHKEAEQSTKMKLLKAAPAITAGLTGTVIGLTQPGKLSAKAASGLGFLAALKGADLIIDGFRNAYKNDIVENPESNKNQKLFMYRFLGIGALALGCASFIKKSAAGEFLSKEASKLAGEINNTKLGKFTLEKIEPFIQKHSKLNSILSIVLPFGTIIGGGISRNKLAKDVVCDIENRANINFEKSKEIQRLAKEEFDAVDAQEI